LFVVKSVHRKHLVFINFLSTELSVSFGCHCGINIVLLYGALLLNKELEAELP